MMIITSRNILVASLLLFNSLLTTGQNFIGLNQEQIMEKMKIVNPKFKIDDNVINPTYKYLKYVDKITEQTILFFLSDAGDCTYVRWISDYSNLNDMIGMLNSKYKKTGVNIWTYTEDGQSFAVKLEEDEWYFMVSFRKK
jgi:hypothetical protein